MSTSERTMEAETVCCSMAGLGGGSISLPRVLRDSISLSNRVPRISKPLLTWFVWYSRRYLRRHFNSLRLTGNLSALSAQPLPLVIYSNHASWWDPLVGLMCLHEHLPNRRAFAPMDAKELQRYGFFKRLGVFGVEPGTSRGGIQFLQTARAILRSSESVLWLTPQGRFADARERPIQLKAGLGHLPSLVADVAFVPVAMEYVFWEERLPEILVRFGEPCRPAQECGNAERGGWTDFFAYRLQETQNELAQQAQRRDPLEFRCLLRGSSGVGGIYDRWRRLRASFRGEQFQVEHGKL